MDELSDIPSEKAIPPSEYDLPRFTPRETMVLAIEAAKVGQIHSAQQVVTNLRKKYGDDLVPLAMDVPEPKIPLDAIPFTLTFAEGVDAGKMISGAMDVDASDEIILDNFGTLQHWGEEWLRNAALCAPFIDADFLAKGSAVQAHELDFSRIRDPKIAVVCGSGSSLDEMTRFLPSFPGLVICGASNASAVLAAGRVPDAILAIDSGIGTSFHLQGVPFDDFGATLIASTTIHPAVPQMFPKNRKWFTSIVQMHRGANHPFNVFCHMLFPYIKSFTFQAGCTANSEILFLNLLTEMRGISFDAIYLLGVDFAYKEENTRCKAYKYENKKFVERDIFTSRTSVQTSSILKRSANGLVTDNAMLEYKRSLLTAWVITKLPLYDCSEGIITEVPKVEFTELAKTGFRQRPLPYSYDEVVQRYNAYLSSIGYIPGKTSGTEGREIDGELWQRP